VLWGFIDSAAEKPVKKQRPSSDNFSEERRIFLLITGPYGNVDSAAGKFTSGTLPLKIGN
jgi:hypothetical protein